MSALFLQGRLIAKTRDFLTLKENFELFKSSDLLEYDLNFRGIIEKKFLTPEQKENFLNEDFRFHFSLIKKEEDEKEFLQAIFLPFDVFRFLIKKAGIAPESKVGYFTDEELGKILKKKFPEDMVKPIRILFGKYLKEKKLVGEKNEIFLLQKKLLMPRAKRLFSPYFRLEESSEKSFVTIFKKFFSKTIPLGSFYPIELAKFYLPHFFQNKFFYFSNPFEFLFFYLKERFILWKVLQPEKI